MIFVQNVQQSHIPNRQPGLAIHSLGDAFPTLNARNQQIGRMRGSTRGARYDATGYGDRDKNDALLGPNGDAASDTYESRPKRGGGADPLHLLPQRTAEEAAADKEDLLSRSRPVGAFGGDKVQAGGSWTEEGGRNGVARSQGEGGGDAVEAGFAKPLSVQQWDALMRQRVLQRRQGRNNGLVSTAISPSNDPNIFRM